MKDEAILWLCSPAEADQGTLPYYRYHFDAPLEYLKKIWSFGLSLLVQLGFGLQIKIIKTPK